MSFVQAPIIVHKGIRGPRFRIFISSILKTGNLKQEYLDLFMQEANFKLFEQSFTHKTAHPYANSEALEFLGDCTLNKAICWYLARRFPQLVCCDGVKIMARLKIMLISTKYFAMFAERLSFGHFISCDEALLGIVHKRAKVLEDAFEAFFGAVEMLLDKHIHLNAGYNACYGMIANLLDTLPISLAYEDLYDAKTRLKELFDVHSDNLGTIHYNNTRGEDGIHTSVVSRVMNGRKIVLGQGEDVIKIEAEKKASEIAISRLNGEGYTKIIPEFYKRIQQNA